MKRITILGSTGSIGSQTLDVIEKSNGEFKVTALSANSNIEVLYNQAVKFKPSYVAVMNPDSAAVLKDRLSIYDIKVLSGIEGLEYIASLEENDIVLNSVVGMIGLRPTLSAIKAGKIIALANKETLVVGGELIKREICNSKAKIIPVDSEHSAIYQCLHGEDEKSVKRLIITASGGPFRGKKCNELLNVTPNEAIKHPKWNMGRKISIDSATLMNKGLEVIEAHFLFNIPYDKIDVYVHPQSIVHSMVEYQDGSIIAQLSSTDMRHPIQYAINYPERKISTIEYLDLLKFNLLTFEAPDIETFECLKLGYEAGRIGGTMTAVLNIANEEAVRLFLDNKIKFLDIPKIIKNAMENHKVDYDITLDKILNIDKEYREYVEKLIK